MLRTSVAVATVVALSAPFASAQITEGDDAVFGLGSITRDAGQDLDFLDIDISANRSYFDVAGQFGAGGDFDGWRHATQQEVAELINNWGFSPTYTPGDGFVTGDVNSVSLVDLVDLVSGVAPATQTFAIGVTATPSSTFANSRMRMYFDVFEGVSEGSIFDGGADHPGHWLVRAVPAPSALALFGAAGLVATRRRR